MKRSKKAKENRAESEEPILLGDESELRFISTSKLTSGLAFQRDVREPYVNWLIRNWKPDMLGSIVVNYRNGRYNVIDGQHRIIAARRIYGRDVIMQCRVYRELTYEEEADLFVKLDMGKKSLTLSQSVTALVEAKTDPEINEILRLVKYEGFHWSVNKRVGGDYEITVARAVLSAYRLLGAYSFSRLLSLLSKTWHGDPASLCSAMFSGLSLFIKTYETEMNDYTFVQQLSGVEPASIIKRSKKDYTTDDHPLRCARVLLTVYNGEGAHRQLPYRFRK